eukprot:9199378-Pyramimonas_sp.AAC.1
MGPLPSHPFWLRGGGLERPPQPTPPQLRIGRLAVVFICPMMFGGCWRDRAMENTTTLASGPL